LQPINRLLREGESGEPNARELEPYDGLAASRGLPEMRRLRNGRPSIPPEALLRVAN
jgi:hypothetical protein